MRQAGLFDERGHVTSPVAPADTDALMAAAMDGAVLVMGNGLPRLRVREPDWVGRIWRYIADGGGETAVTEEWAREVIAGTPHWEWRTV